MSDAFNVAARLRMNRGAFEQGLGSPLGAVTDALDLSGMYRGWYWEESPVPAAPKKREAPTVRDALAARLDDVETTLTAVSHVDDHLLLFDHMMIGPDHARAQHTMAMLAIAGAQLEPKAKGYFLYWADISARLPDKSGVISLAVVERAGTRFLGPSHLEKPRGALGKTLAFLKPTESLFGELVSEALGDGSYPDIAVLRSTKFVDPAVLG
jgi:hypothetical protein